MTDPMDGAGPGDSAEGPDGVGSVGEEAAKLFGALSEWARDQGHLGPDLGAAVGSGWDGLAGHAAGALGALDDHLATGSRECTWCPVCRAVHAVRQTSPEVREHLQTAASSLLQAAAGLLATIPPQGSAPSRGPGFERIDLDGEDHA